MKGTDLTDHTVPTQKRPSRQSLADSIYEILLSRLVEGHIKAGSAINIDSYARDLAVSPTPVREALARLEATGLVTREALRGYRAAPLFTREQLLRLTEARQVIEPSCAQFATSNADDEFVESLRTNIHDMQQLMQDEQAQSYGQYRETDEQFHDLIATQANNEFLFRAYKSLEAHVQRFRLFGALGASDIQHAVTEHQAILDAIAAGDPVRAAEVMAAHIEGVRTRAIHDRDTLPTE